MALTYREVRRQLQVLASAWEPMAAGGGEIDLTSAARETLEGAKGLLGADHAPLSADVDKLLSADTGTVSVRTALEVSQLLLEATRLSPRVVIQLPPFPTLRRPKF